MTLLTCVPNFSDGRDPEVAAAIRSALTSAHGALLLDWHSDPDHNRSVATVAGSPGALVEAARAAVECAAARIDLNRHQGVHPRLGATDVCPFVPVPSGTMGDCVAAAHALGARVGRELDLPVYYYGLAARRPERRELPAVRGRGFEALRRAIEGDPSLAPDAGPARLHPRAGAIAIGARTALVAFNVDLECRDVALARSIAASIRETNGGLAGIRALGFWLERQGCVQVSINVCAPERTGLVEVFTAVAERARAAGVRVRRSELVGLAPRSVLDESVARAVMLPGFDPRRHVLEAVLEERGVV